MAEKIYPSLLQIQSKLKAPKNQYNSFGKYKYRNAEDILKAAKPLNAKYNCVPVITSEISEINGASYVEVKIKLVQAEDGSSVEVTGFAKETDHKKGMDPAQVTGATFSYALKYALNGLYAIDDTKDVDTNEYEYQQKGQQQWQQQQADRRQNNQYSQPQQNGQKISKPQQNRQQAPKQQVTSNTIGLEKQYTALRKQIANRIHAYQKDVESGVREQASKTPGWAKMSKDAKYQKMIDIMKEMYKE